MINLNEKFTYLEEKASGSKVRKLDRKKLRASLFNFVKDQRAIAYHTEEPDIEYVVKRWWSDMKEKHGSNWILFLNNYADRDYLIDLGQELYEKYEPFQEEVDNTWSYVPGQEGNGSGVGTDSGGTDEGEDKKRNLKDWEGSDAPTPYTENGQKDEGKRRNTGPLEKYAQEYGTTESTQPETDSVDVEQSDDSEQDSGDSGGPGPSGEGSGLSSWAERHGTTDDIGPEKQEVEVNRIIQGDCKEVMMNMRANTVDMVITSPPYWAARAYEIEDEAVWEDGEWVGQLGHEPTPDMFVEHLMEVMDACRRILKPTGTLWVNIDDTYGGVPGGYYDSQGYSGGSLGSSGNRPSLNIGGEVRQKDLAGVPERFVLAMQANGWYRRNTIHWCKQVLFEDDDVKGATKPSAAKDRFVEKAVEYLYFFTQNPHYEFNLDDVRRPHKTDPTAGQHYTDDAKMVEEQGKEGGSDLARKYDDKQFYHEEGGNLPTAWQVNPARSSEAHYAPYPERLIERAIISGCPKDGVVLDPFAGTGTTCVVAAENERHYIGIEMSEKYAEIARRNAPSSTQRKLF